MLKGTQKKMIVVQGTASSMFETVYFVLKRDAEKSSRYGEKDMIGEANRIISENMLEPTKKRSMNISRWASRIFTFLLGVLSGVGAMMLWYCFA